MQEALTTAMEAGVVVRQPVPPLAHLLLGALSEAAMMIAHADDEQATRRSVEAALGRLLEGLRTPSAQPVTPRRRSRRVHR